jgi:tRNA dimethylallyltransferase
VELARRFNGEIVSADSRQVYRGMDIGTGKDLDEYHTGGTPVAYHLIDIVDPGEDYNLFRFVTDARQAIAEIHQRQHLPIVVGGTPLYINALLEKYALEGGGQNQELRKTLSELSDDELLTRLQQQAPDVYARTDKSQRKRVIRAIEIAASRSTANKDEQDPGTTITPLLLAPYYHRREVHNRIQQRLDQRLQNGLVEEVQALHDHGLSWERLEFFGLEYRYAAYYLQGKLSYAEFREQLFTRIRRFGKAQDVWFRKMEREGKNIYWLPAGDLDQAINLVTAFLHDQPLPKPEIRLQNTLYGPRS